MRMGNFHKGLCRGSGNFTAFRKTSGMIESGKGPLNHLVSRKFFPFVRLDFFRNVNIQVKLLTDIGYKSVSIPSVCAEAMSGWIALMCVFRIPPFCIMNIRGMDNDRQSIPMLSTTMCRSHPFVFPYVNSSFFVGCNSFYASGIDNCVTRLLLTPNIFRVFASKYSKILFPSPLIRPLVKAVYG